MGAISLTKVSHVSILELSVAWLEMATASEESTMGGVNTDWMEKLNGADNEVVVMPETVM